ncbi:sugar phosphate isomerase/epimerase [Jatrophihabitans sp. GAS493]|uniref:sugar phosphate isomerase/epimerase family protein n=1 Tax=Jatrophihabitans sp. GAS493 TaxID=1907575 RepID=UPI000BB87A64|nr:sugar phosphate isomerase/epimerase family protein [Jatrophihabitans sp. GAS493]SOD72596.1 sugar phosphate isomerase/epimerase [Jatrophihabitans sp. GAS493]
MRIGVDGSKIPEAVKRGPIGSLEHGQELGLSGLFFRTVLDLSPTLDAGELRAIRQRADELGMYMEAGLGKVNPYANPEVPELRAIGDGDIVLGFRRMMEACAAIDCRELWVALASYKWMFRGRLAYDRFRTDVDWSDQLAASTKFLKRLAPIARDLGIHLNLETHEEVTSFELVRMVEEVGPDVTGIVFDTSNVLQRIEHPVWAARRVAPYVRQTHLKDGLLSFGDGGLDYQHRPCGDGVIDFGEILPILADVNPTLNLTIENPQAREDALRPASVIFIELFDPEFLAGHPDLTVGEYAAFIQLAHDYAERLAAGEIPDRLTYGARPYDFEAAIALIKKGAAHLRSVCIEKGLPLSD